MKKLVLFSAFTIGFGMAAHAQVKFGDNPATINGGSLLELESADKGFLPTRISLADRLVWGLAGTPVNGMIVFNTNSSGTNGLDTGIVVWQGQWNKLVTQDEVDKTDDEWINDPATTRIHLGKKSDGTTARPAGTEVVVVDNGLVGIGTSNPTGKLHVKTIGDGNPRFEGNATGAANVVVLRFQDSNGIRTGFVGDGSALNSNIQLISDSADVMIVAGSNTAPGQDNSAIFRNSYDASGTLIGLKMGLGINAPAAKLHIVKNAADITPVIISGCPVHADNAAAIAAGVPAGGLYRTSTGVLMVRF